MVAFRKHLSTTYKHQQQQQQYQKQQQQQQSQEVSVELFLTIDKPPMNSYKNKIKNTTAILTATTLTTKQPQNNWVVTSS